MARIRLDDFHFRAGRKRPRRKGGEPERAPVKPDKPNSLTGGAAAELQFDD